METLDAQLFTFSYDAIEKALASGANPRAENEFGLTPLVFAAKENRPGIFFIFLENASEKELMFALGCFSDTVPRAEAALMILMSEKLETEANMGICSNFFEKNMTKATAGVMCVASYSKRLDFKKLLSTILETGKKKQLALGFDTTGTFLRAACALVETDGSAAPLVAEFMKRHAAKSLKKTLDEAGKEWNKKHLRWRTITENAIRLSAALAANMGAGLDTEAVL